MPINYSSQRDDRTVSEHAAPGIQRQYRDDRSERRLTSNALCDWCGHSLASCRDQPCRWRVQQEQPGRHCATCSCP